MSRHVREVCTFGDSLGITFFLLWSCAIALLSGSAWQDLSVVQAMLSCPSQSIACAVEETDDDNVATLSGLSSDPLKENTSGQNRAVDGNCARDYEKALTSELAAKRMKTGKQLARVDGVDTMRLRDTLSKEMLACQCAGFRTFRDLRGASSNTEDGTRMEEPFKEKILYLALHVGTNIAIALPIQVCGSPNTGSETMSPDVESFHA